MTISIVIPVVNEQQRINSLIEHLKGVVGRGQEIQEPEIIVVDGDAEGSTLSAVADSHVIGITAPQGRGVQLAAGVSHATGEIILLLHADTQLPEHGVARVADAVAGGADWGAFRLGIDAPGWAYRVIAWSVDVRCKLFALPYGDQAVFVTRAALESVGGIPPIPLMEDVELAWHLRKAGKRFILLPQRIRTSARRWQRDGIVRRTLHNWWLLVRYLTGVDPEHLAKEYR